MAGTHQIKIGDQMVLFPISPGSAAGVVGETTRASGANTTGRKPFDASKWASGQKTLDYFQQGNGAKHDFLPEWPQLSPTHQGHIASLLGKRNLKISVNGVVYDPKDNKRKRN